MAKKEGADRILVAGDLYDNDAPSPKTLLEPLERMKRCGHVQSHIIPGNHDPHRSQGLWDRARAAGLPGDVHLLLSLRPDGWPQVTTVGYVHTDLVLYFAVASTSQKFLNIQRDPRVSIAIAFAPKTNRQGHGLSMAARASQVIELVEVEQINEALASRYFGRAVFAPHGPSAVILRADPTIISLVDDSDGLSQPQVFHVPNH